MRLTVKFEFCDGLQMGRNRKELLDIFIFKPWDLKKKMGAGGQLLCIAINTWNITKYTPIAQALAQTWGFRALWNAEICSQY